MKLGNRSPKINISIILISLLLFSCKERSVPFPFVPNLPTDYNLSTTYAGEMTGAVSMFSSETLHEYYNGIVSQETACFDTAGRCLDLYYRDRETCQHITFVYDSTSRRIEERCYIDTAGTPFDSLTRLYTHTTYSYSCHGRHCKARITGPDGKRHTFRLRYDKQGLLKRFIYPDGSRFSYDHDTIGRLVKLTYPDASFERYEYDIDGRLTTMIDRAGKYTWYAAPPPASRRDSLGRVLEQVVGSVPRSGSSDDSSAPIIATYVYDHHGNWIRRTTAGVSSPTILEVRTFKYYL